MSDELMKPGDMDTIQAPDFAAAEASQTIMEDPNRYVELMDGSEYEIGPDPDDENYWIMRARVPVMPGAGNFLPTYSGKGPEALTRFAGFCRGIAIGEERGAAMGNAMRQETGEDN